MSCLPLLLTVAPFLCRYRVFGGPGSGDLASPAALADALRQYKSLNAQLTAQLDEMKAQQQTAEESFKEVLRQHHAAWAADRTRESKRHAQEIDRLRDMHANELSRRALRQPQLYADATAATTAKAHEAELHATAPAGEA